MGLTRITKSLRGILFSVYYEFSVTESIPMWHLNHRFVVEAKLSAENNICDWLLLKKEKKKKRFICEAFNNWLIITCDGSFFHHPLPKLLMQLLNFVFSLAWNETNLASFCLLPCVLLWFLYFARQSRLYLSMDPFPACFKLSEKQRYHYGAV